MFTATRITAPTQDELHTIAVHAQKVACTADSSHHLVQQHDSVDEGDTHLQWGVHHAAPGFTD